MGDSKDIIERVKRDPRWFVREILGETPWSKQVEILEAIRDHKEVAVKSCHGIGKDWVAARAVLWFLCAHSPSLVVTTGPTDRQVRGILWKEINAAYAKSRVAPGGRILTQELRLSEDQWALGFTSGDDPTRFQGFHSRNILVVIDEACGVGPDTYNAVDALLSSENAHRLEIGNPTDPTSAFATSFRTPGIHTISVDAFESPNLESFGITEEDIASGDWRGKVDSELPYPELVTPEWVAKRYVRWGPSSPMYQSRVRAHFPEQGEDTLIPLAHIEAAHQAELLPLGPVILGVDVARFGSNRTVVATRQGPVVRIHRRSSKQDTMVTAGHVRRDIRELGAKGAYVDVVGLGAGVVDRLRELSVIGVQAFNGGLAPIDEERFVNRRAECYWQIREAAERGELDLDRKDEDLAGQLAQLRWMPDSRGRVQIESKIDMAKRGVPSPDDADAASMTFAGNLDVAIVTSAGRRLTSGLHPRHGRARLGRLTGSY